MPPQIQQKSSLDSHHNNMLFSERILGPISSEFKSKSSSALSKLTDPLSHGSGGSQNLSSNNTSL